MFRNKWNLMVDTRMRLALPSSVVWRGYDDSVYIAEGKDGCVEIFPGSADINALNTDSRIFISVFTEEKKQKGGVILRITIPCAFKHSCSFYCGKEITLVRGSNHLVLWPGWVPVV